MRATVIQDAGALAALVPAWADLFARVPGAPPFAAPAWLLPWWEVFEPGRLFTVALHREDKLVGLAPLYVEHGRFGRRLLPLGIGISDQLDILLDPGHAAEAGAALIAALVAARDAFDLWSAEEAPAGAGVLGLQTPEGWRSTVEPHSPCPVLPLPPGRPAVSVVPRGKLRKWRMARHRTARRAAVLATVSADTLPAALASLFALHGARWESRGEPGVLGDPLVRRFHEAAAPALLRAGLLDMAVLTLDGAAAGVFYGLRTPAAGYAYLGGFDPRFAFESPGTILIGAALERAVAGGAAVFSFLRGEEPYKFEWGAISVPNARRTLEPPR